MGFKETKNKLNMKVKAFKQKNAKRKALAIEQKKARIKANLALAKKRRKAASLDKLDKQAKKAAFETSFIGKATKAVGKSFSKVEAPKAKKSAGMSIIDNGDSLILNKKEKNKEGLEVFGSGKDDFGF